MFVDYTKAFDMVSHPKLFKVLLEMGIPKHIVVLVQALYAQQTAKMRWYGESSEAFTIGKGTRQGCNISPVEFNLCAKDITRRTLENNEHGIKVGWRQINNFRYANDTTLLTTTEESINDMAVKKALKVRLMKSLVWSVFLYGAESWTIKRSDRDGINSLEMWCWRRV